MKKTLDRTINEDQNQFPKTLFFFDFFNPLKQIKIKLCSSKTLEKLGAKTLRKIETFALENLDQNSPKGWVFITHSKN